MKEVGNLGSNFDKGELWKLNKRVLVMMLTVVLVLSNIFSLDIQAGGYVDVKKGDYGYDSIKWSLDNGVVDVEGNNFKVNQRITEGEFLTYLFNYLDFSEEVLESTVDKDLEEGSLDYIYDVLRKAGIVGYGTNYKEMRNRVLTVEEAASLIVGMYKVDAFLTSTDMVDKFIEEVFGGDVTVEDEEELVEVDGNNEEVVEKLIRGIDDLTRLSAVMMLHNFDKSDNELDVRVEIDPDLGEYETHYFGDWNKRLFNYYPESGLVVNLVELRNDLSKEQSYYKELRGKEVNIDKSKDNYMVVLSSVGGKTIDFYGYAVVMVDKDGPVTLEDRRSFVALKGKSKMVTVVSGEEIESIKLVVGGNLIELDLDKLNKFPGKRFFSDRGRGLEWNLFFVGDSVEENVNQVERRLYLQNR